jgi:hypothetical protein
LIPTHGVVIVWHAGQAGLPHRPAGNLRQPVIGQQEAFVKLVAPQASLCIGMDAVDQFRNALALDPDKAEHYEFFALAAVVQRAIKPAY